MRRRLLILFFLFPQVSSSQQSLTKEQINRLADAGKVYGYIKYFHPFLQYKDINWDSAFAANVDGIIAATNRNQYAAVMQRLLFALNDNVTGATIISKRDSAYQARPTTYEVRDSILYISMNDAPSYDYGNPENAYDRLQAALQNIGRVKGIIFDMRRPPNSTYNSDAPSGQVVGWSTAFFKGDLLMPSRRSMGYLGLNWQAYFKQSSLQPVHGDAKKEVPLIFIVANEGQLPLLATVLQQQGKAAILQQEGKELLPGNSATFYISDSVLVKARTDEAVNQSGFLLTVRPNATYSPSEQPSAAIETAEKLLLNGFRDTPKPAQYAPMPITRRANYVNQGNYPSTGYRMLAAATIFSTIEYFFAGKYLMDNNWEASYKAAIARFVEARDSLEYMRAVAQLYSNIDDSHGFITRTPDGFSLRLNPIIQGRGNFVPPVVTRVIENRVVVRGIYNDSVCKAIGIEKGDVILSIDGRDAIQLVEDARKYQNASTKASQTFYVSSFLLFGKEGQTHRLTIADRRERTKQVSMPTLREFNGDFFSDDYVYRMFSQHPGATVKMLTKDIGYADLSGRLKDADNDSIVRILKNTNAVILDMRGYPHGGGINPFSNVFGEAKTVGERRAVHLAPSSENVTNDPLVTNEDARTTTFRGESRAYAGWVYRGKTVVLTDETAQSWAENVVQALKDRGATIIGSPTAGAMTGTTNFDIPGNLTLWLSEADLLLPNGKSLQRSGVQPDISVRPSIKGLQAGKDEVLERAVKFLQTGR